MKDTNDPVERVKVENIEIERLPDEEYLITVGQFTKKLPFQRVVTRRELISLKMAINRIKK